MSSLQIVYFLFMLFIHNSYFFQSTWILWFTLLHINHGCNGSNKPPELLRSLAKFFTLFINCHSQCQVLTEGGNKRWQTVFSMQVCTLVSVSPSRAMQPALLGLALTLPSSCSMEQRSAMRASRSTFSPWFSASVQTQTSAWDADPERGLIKYWPKTAVYRKKKIQKEYQKGHLVAHYEKKKKKLSKQSQTLTWCLTVDVVDGKSVGEVGHVCILSERSFLLRRLCWTSII